VEQKLCKRKDELLVRRPVGVPNENLGLYTHSVRFSGKKSYQPKDAKMKIEETGMYILWLSNCGNVSSGVLSGSVVVKNPYGFLPGNEYHKMPFYGWLGILYMMLACIWLSLSVWWWRELFSIQNCIAGVILLGLVESFLWYGFFSDWNSAGNHSKILFIASVFSSVAKSAFSYMLILVASLGWGVTRPYLDEWGHNRIWAVCALYVGLGVIREVVLTYRDTQSLALWVVLICFLPVSILNGIIFYWVFMALSTLMETLKERRQREKLVVFQRLWFILVLSLGIATVTLLYQIFSLSHHNTSWKHDWLFTDGVSHILFFMVLVAMMYLWAPHKHSQRYAYSQAEQTDDWDYCDQVDATRIGAPSIWTEVERIDDLEDDELSAIAQVELVSMCSQDGESDDTPVHSGTSTKFASDKLIVKVE